MMKIILMNVNNSMCEYANELTNHRINKLTNYEKINNHPKAATCFFIF